METDITLSEKVVIAKKIVRYTPSGELNNVLSDLYCLLDSEKKLDINNALKNVSKQYQECQLLPVDVHGSQRKCLISMYNNLNGTTYYDPRTSQTFSFDPVTAVSSNFQKNQCAVYFSNDSVCTFWSVLDEAACTYVKSRYPNGNASVFIMPSKTIAETHYNLKEISKVKHSYDDKTFHVDFSDDMFDNMETLQSNDLKNDNDGSIQNNSSNFHIFNVCNSPRVYIICIESHDYQYQNYWTSSWISQWILIPCNQYTCNLIGVVKAQVHYFEDSNIQFNSQRRFKHVINNVNLSSIALGTEIIKAISTSEDAYQAYINNSQSTMSEQILKSLRRQLPVTKSKINWDVLVSYRDMRELNNSDQHSENRRSS